MPRRGRMRVGERRGGPLLALGSIAVLAAAMLAALLWPAASPGTTSSDRQARLQAAPGPVTMPREPIGAGSSGATTDRGLRLSREFLLSGRPGQQLRVRLRTRSAPAGAPVRVVLRAGGDRGALAAARTRLSDSGALTVRLDGLNPPPGSYAVVVRRNGARAGALLARGSIDSLAQSRSAPFDRAAPAPSRARVSRAGQGAAAEPNSLPGSEVNHDLSFAPGSEASSAVSVETDNPGRVLVATNRAGSGPRLFVSDQGTAPGSVAEVGFPDQTAPPGGGAGPLAVCCDPVVAADSGGQFWVAATSTVGPGMIVVNRTGSAGSTLRSSNTGLPIGGASSANEKPSIAVEDGGRIAVAWIETAPAGQRVVFSQCDSAGDAASCDAGASWSPPIAVSAAPGPAAMPSLDFAPNGDAYVVWWDAGPGNAVRIDRCQSGEDCSQAAAWDEDATVADLDSLDDDGIGGADPLPLFCPIIAAPGGLLNPSPSVEVGPLGNVMVAYSDLRDNEDPAAPSRCTGSGSDRTFDSYVAVGAVNSLPAPNSGVRLSQQADSALALNDHFLPAISADPGDSAAIEASFTSTLADPGGQESQRYYVRSDDLGVSWSAPTPVSSAASRFAGPISDGIDYGDRQGADSAAGVFRPAWTDNRALQARDADLYVRSPPVQTTIDSAPAGTIAEASVSIGFSTPAPRVACFLDTGPIRPCSSPRALGPLENGPHTFSVGATDQAGNRVDPSPATASWDTQDVSPPETILKRKPPRKTKRARPRFAFTSDEEGVKFECRYDRGEWLKCKSPQRERVEVGKHRFRVRAFDFARNTDRTPAKARFKRIAKKRKCTGKRKRNGRC